MDNPQTYAHKYGIILQLFRFNHNIKKLIYRKYKVLYIKSLIALSKEQQYGYSRVHTGYGLRQSVIGDGSIDTVWIGRFA